MATATGTVVATGGTPPTNATASGTVTAVAPASTTYTFRGGVWVPNLVFRRVGGVWVDIGSA